MKNNTSNIGKVDVVVGVQWGDEGKGKVVQHLLDKNNYSWCARYQGGGNAGHTIYDKEDDSKIVLHSIPTGIVYSGMKCVIGNGELVDFKDLLKEISELKTNEKFRGLLYISDRAHVTHPYLQELETSSGDKSKFGTTGHAIGPTYTMKAARKGLRVCDFQSLNRVKSVIKEAVDAYGANKEFNNGYISETAEEQMRLFDYILIHADVTDTSHLINTWLASRENGLAEGAQGTGLSIDHGTYPHVTSSSTEAGGVCTGLGVGPTKIRKVYGVAKAYVTRVGTGPFPTLMDENTEEMIRTKGGEYGATTNRPRRCGWYDSVLARKAVEVNGIDELILTKADVLSCVDKIFASTAYQKSSGETTEIFPPDMLEGDQINSSNYKGILNYEQESWGPINKKIPTNLKKYLKFIHDTSGAAVTILSTGPEIDDTIIL